MFWSRIGVEQFWLATFVTLMSFLVLVIILEVTTIPLFSIITGISLFSLPDLALAPMRTVLLVGIGFALTIIPFVFLLIFLCGLHLRRFHDLGLSLSVWVSVVLAGTVSIIILAQDPVMSLICSIMVFSTYFAMLSWPGDKEENLYGVPVRYTYITGALLGTNEEGRHTKRLLMYFVLPVFYLQVFGLVLAYGVHTVFPRAAMLHFNTPTLEAPISALKETPANQGY
jgi:uncharacterized membrane protein YhaH (DUF805 family)